MAISDSIGNMVDAALGTSSGTNLNSFLTKFYSSEGKFVDTLDPKSTFDVSIKFYPTFETTGSSGEWYEKLGNAALNVAKSSVKSLANNVTGGLIGSIMNGRVDIMSKHNKFSTGNGKQSYTFIEYLAAANMLVGKSDWIGESAGEAISPLELQFGPYVQDITVPNIVMQAEAKSITSIGEFPINSPYLKPDNSTLTMTILNTKAAVHERIFYPWMREVTLPYWSYNTQPYTTATITIDFTKHNDVKYVFCGCRPSQIFTMQGNQDTSDAANLKRQVVFVFDYMFITSKLLVAESWQDKLLSTGKALAGSAAHALNI